MNQKRKRYLVDRSVQLRVAGRIALYWVSSILFVVLPLSFYRMMMGEGGLLTDHIVAVFADYGPVFMMMFLFLPFAIMDSIKVSNRFAGPIYRLRTELKKREEGQQIGPIKFRDGDYYSDLPATINALISQVDDLEAAVENELQHDVVR